MRVLAGVAEELAKDDLAGFNRVRVEWGKAVVEARAAGTNAPAAKQIVELPEARDLATARKLFHGLVEAWTPVVLAARKQEGFGELKVYRCPMTAKAFPGAPAKAVWWQFGGPLRNPWFGAEMLDCGTEVP
jgi:hypothetical protein